MRQLRRGVAVSRLRAVDVVLHRPLPAGFDLPFVVYLSRAVTVAILMSRLPAVRRGAAWLESAKPA